MEQDKDIKLAPFIGSYHLSFVKTSNKTILYDNWWIIYLIIPLSSILTSNIGIEDFSREMKEFYFWPNNFWALFMGYSQYFVARFIYLKFDTIQPYYKAVIISLIVSLPVISLWASCMDYFYVSVVWGYDWPLESDFLTTELPIIWLWVIILYLIFFVMKVSVMHDSLDLNKNTEVSNPRSSTVQAYFGNKTLNIPCTDIAYIYLENKICFLKTMENNIYRIDKTLNELEAELPVDFYHRANRQLFVNRNAIVGFEMIPTRKLKLELNPPHEELQYVSKTKITSFKNWFNNHV